MAFRIHDSVKSGELDFRTKGKITGHLDLVGSDIPVYLDLKGLPHPDLAGLLMRFQNSKANQPLPYDLNPLQQGQPGDMTASRKNKVLDCSMEEFEQHYVNKTQAPYHWGNTLYLEWFSHSNGRVVVEVGDAEIQVEGTPTWQMTPEEESQQLQDMANALQNFMRLLEESLEEDPPEDDGE